MSLSRVRTLLYHVRYGHPTLWRLGILAVAAVLLINTVVAFQNTGFLRESGIAAVGTRAAAMKDAAYWTLRSWINATGAQSSPMKRYGYIHHGNSDGTITVTVIEDDHYVSRRILPADIVMGNPGTFTASIASLRDRPVDLELYAVPGAGYPYAVIWLDARPLNIELVASGAAIADPNPPTNIVDKIFANYYWHLATRK